MDYYLKIKALTKNIPVGLVDFGQPRDQARTPTQASSNFITNKEQGDWAENLVAKAINGTSNNFVAVKYGKSDDLVAGEYGFDAFFQDFQAELDTIGKRPDLLIFNKADFDSNLGFDISQIPHDQITDYVKKAIAGIEVRSSAFLIDRYEEAMQLRTKKFTNIALQTKDKILAEFLDVLQHPARQSYIDLLNGITAKTLNVTDFRTPNWGSSDRLIQVKELFRQLKTAIKEIQKRDYLSITPKVEDIKVVYKWIETFNVPHFYFQVFFDKVYGISFEQILTIISDPDNDGVIFSVEADTKNQNKTTIKINSKSGIPIASKVDEPLHESVRKEMDRGRLLFYVTFKGGTAYLDIENLKTILEINKYRLLMTVAKQPILNNLLENDYSKSISIEHRKKFAQFFTPFPIADLMAKWILGNKNLYAVLEPAFGLGVFSRAILNYKEDVQIKGFEIDATIYEKAIQYFDETENIDICLKNYMYGDWECKYDGIICNPPYFKFHDYDNKNILKEIEIKLKCKLNGFTNLYTLFLLKSIHQLSQNGRCAYIIPSEFLNSDYGKLVKSYLIQSKTLRHIIVIDFEENVFDDALTTASIIFCANDNLTNRVQFSNIQSIQDLSKIDTLIASYPNFLETESSYSFSELNPEIKWKAYYQKQNSTKFKNLVPFSTYAKVVRGIATGSNDYFTFNMSKAKEYGIEEQYLLPCICSAKDAKTTFFTTQNFEDLKMNNKTIFLFNAQSATDKNILAYIQKGEKEAINKRFLTSTRTPWYLLENRKPAPIWVAVFNRTGLRFIRNEANVSNLTSYHCIYPNQTNLFPEIDIDLLFAYLLTDTAKQIFEDNSRQYGNGLQKFEPNDLNKGMMLDIGLLDKPTINKILDLYRTYKTLILDNKNGNEIIDKIDKILIESATYKKQTLLF